MSKLKHKKKKIIPKHGLQYATSSSLIDKIKNSGFFGDKELTIVNSTGEKMSEVLWDFAEPLLDGIDNHHVIEKAISFAILVWNLSMLPKSAQKKELDNVLSIIGKDDPEYRNIGEHMVRMLLERKERYFPNNKRFIISHEFGLNNGKPCLNVASTIG